MSASELDKRLARYEWFDDARVLTVGLSLGPNGSAHSAWIELNAYRTNAPLPGGEKVRVRVMATADTVFAWKNYFRNENITPNYPAKLLRSENLTILDFDPLHPSDRLGDVPVSDFFIGGKTLSIEEIA